ncbi:MAG: DUF3408 domain-containing protein [Alistipes indistinctus]
MSSKRRRIVLPDYANTFLKHSTLRRRVTVNINEETRDTLIAILQHIGPFHLSLGGYAENILRNHIESLPGGDQQSEPGQTRTETFIAMMRVLSI